MEEMLPNSVVEGAEIQANSARTEKRSLSVSIMLVVKDGETDGIPRGHGALPGIY